MLESQNKDKDTKESKIKEEKIEEPTLKKEDFKETESKKEPEKLKEKEGKESGDLGIKDIRYSILFKRKPLKLLLLLLQDKSWYPSLIARESGQSYVNATKILSALEKMELIVYESTKKKRIIKLTEKGAKLAKSIDEIIGGI